MPFDWTDDLSRVDWGELSALYRGAPLGDKAPADLAPVFGNSMFRIFAFDAGMLVGAGRGLGDGRDCAYLCDIAVLPTYQARGVGKEITTRLLRLAARHRKINLYAARGKQGFYKRFGFGRMQTAMAIFPNPKAAVARGYLEA
jgi:ribosomal protein S18 acetylase RimI-like enzyme